MVRLVLSGSWCLRRMSGCTVRLVCRLRLRFVIMDGLVLLLRDRVVFVCVLGVVLLRCRRFLRLIGSCVVNLVRRLWLTWLAC